MHRSFKDAFVQHGEQHIMVELRDQGYVEINGLHDAPEAAKHLEQFYQSQGCKAGALSLCPPCLCSAEAARRGCSVISHVFA